MTTREKAIAIAGACHQIGNCCDCPVIVKNSRNGLAYITCYGGYKRYPKQIEQNFAAMFAANAGEFSVFDKEEEEGHQQMNEANPIFKAEWESILKMLELAGVELPKDNVEHPAHYTSGGIECIEAIKASMNADGFQDYCKGNIIKYIWRWRKKGGVEDLKKAQVYLGWLIQSADNKESEDKE